MEAADKEHGVAVMKEHCLFKSFLFGNILLFRFLESNLLTPRCQLLLVSPYMVMWWMVQAGIDLRVARRNGASSHSCPSCSGSPIQGKERKGRKGTGYIASSINALNLEASSCPAGCALFVWAGAPQKRGRFPGLNLGPPPGRLAVDGRPKLSGLCG
eukprot:595622-Pelagomonas_calceolata.AAC.2